MNGYKLGDLIDMGMLQKLADSNYKASGLPMTIIDAFDLSILLKAGWPEICSRFHRAHPLSEQRCRLSDNYVGEHLDLAESFQYKCQNGLWHIAIPIVVDGTHLATIFLTQFFFEGELPDRNFFTRQAQEFGYDLKPYLAAIDAMPVFSREKVDFILDYYKALKRFIVDLCGQSLQVIETQKSLIESEEKYRSLVNNIDIGVYRNIVTGKFSQVNPAMARIFGYATAEDLMEKDATVLYQVPTDRALYIEELKHIGLVKNKELAMQKKDGTRIWCSVSVKAQYDESGEIAWMDGVVEDISERRKAREELQRAHDELEDRVRERTAALAAANELLLVEIAERTRVEEKLKKLSELDPLLAIFNRRKLFELMGLELAKVKRYGRPLCLLMLDLDHFKQVNDIFGHDIGDEVLKTTAKKVKSLLRNTDIFARYGGEEFVAVLPETNLAGATSLAEKIRTAVEQHFYPVAGRITVSIGAAQLSGRSETAEGLIKRADEALYSAKREGRNQVAPASAPAV